jgi:hypothetical protein
MHTIQKLNSIIFFIVSIALILNVCDVHAQDESSWSGRDPLSIPLKVRQEYYKKGNLVLNPSFEQVNIGKNDSLIFNFKLAHWEVVGKEVQLTDIKSKYYNEEDAFHGTHAIKIVRTSKDVREMDNPKEGILSDYIKVIPGNYNFFFDIRLQKIIPGVYPDRFQGRIGKNIDIRLEFFDKNKMPLDPGIYFDYVHKKIDNGFKGFAFSNYFYIDTFKWARVRGRTWAYPFSEGDIPDQCSYVRIFFGLNCPGTMWIDNVDFRLSRWNFTPLERMDSFFKKKYDLTDLLIPTPKFISNKQHLSLKNQQINLVYDKTMLSENQPAVRLLKERLSGIKGDLVKINAPASSGELQIQFIKDNSSLSGNFKTELRSIRDKAQGYFIRKEGNTIYLGANQPVGWYYAASTLSQLIDTGNRELDYADITDYPDFTGRSALLFGYQNKWSLEQNKSLSDSAIRASLLARNAALKQQLKDIDFYASYKLNDLYSLYFNLSKRWWLPGNFYKTYFDTIGNYCDKNYKDIMHVGVQINPYFHFDMEQMVDTLSDSLKEIFSHESEESFDKITGVLKPALDAGARTVMLCADDYVPHLGIIRGEYTLFNPEDKKEFTNLAAAQAYLLNKLQAWLDKNYGRVRLEFVPPAYNNWFIDYGRGTAQTYFQDLTGHLDSSIVLVWTGEVIRSLAYDAANMQRATLLYKQKPMVWDNSPYARMVESANGGYPINYPLKSVMCDLFEPLDIQYPHDFTTYLNSHYYSNNSGSGEINKIKNMTFADFAWNTDAYNPDFSLFKAFVHTVGEKNGRLLLLFNQAYFQFVASWGELRMSKENDPAYKLSRQQRQKADNEIKELKNAFNAISPIKNDELKQELKNIMNAKIEAWNKLVK